MRAAIHLMGNVVSLLSRAAIQSLPGSLFLRVAKRTVRGMRPSCLGSQASQARKRNLWFDPCYG